MMSVGQVLVRLRWVSLAIVGGALVSVATAQADWVATQTGAVEFVLAGEGREFYTFALEVPENVADGMPEGPVRDRLEAAAGTTEHSATWSVSDPVVFGGVVLLDPADLQVTLGTRPTQDQHAGLGVMLLDFSLTLDGLELSDPVDFPWSLRFYPESYTVSDFYALTEGTFEVVSVERVDDVTLRVTGSFDGVLSRQARLGTAVHNPNDTLPISGTFDVRQVVGVKSLSEVLGSSAQ